MRPNDCYSLARTSARSSTFLSLLAHATGLPGAAVWTGYLASLSLDLDLPRRWLASCVPYLDLLLQAMAYMPSGASVGEVESGQIDDLARGFSTGEHLILGPLDRSSLCGRPAPLLWEGAPTFVQIIGCEENTGAMILRLPGTHSLCSLSAEALVAPPGMRSAWFAATPLGLQACEEHLRRLLSSCRLEVVCLADLARWMRALCERIAGCPLTSTERHCLRAALRALQECLCDATLFAQRLQKVAQFLPPAEHAFLIERAVSAMHLLARAPSVLVGFDVNPASWLEELGRVLATTTVVRLAPKQ
ncbi:hypothetical protein CfE428DRAFT_1312 [Chthoniobacter flavus Ellin428]|uniref:Uncharacterized protein n=1 Tax=Chthoniobacter flavus Ellin428 TaxID=497964 RepID=B4CXM1_9BACT|nr:hypothetical protein CfE428DRAFT_1312 [Chthoniobacter flavus Ellin428]TCO88744.1 hypothetical protein EV701_116116 [Chthoniobacter flavus]